MLALEAPAVAEGAGDEEDEGVVLARRVGSVRSTTRPCFVAVQP